MVGRMNAGLMSSETDEWATPLEFFLGLDYEFHFEVDVCASEANAKVRHFFTRDDDGLAQAWAPLTCWMNPPYGATIGRWCEKAWLESQMGATVVGLLPARTDTAWWHKFVLQAAEVRFIRGRLKFSGKGTAPFPSAVVVWRPDAVATVARGLGSGAAPRSPEAVPPVAVEFLGVDKPCLSSKAAEQAAVVELVAERGCGDPKAVAGLGESDPEPEPTSELPPDPLEVLLGLDVGECLDTLTSLPFGQSDEARAVVPGVVDAVTREYPRAIDDVEPVSLEGIHRDNLDDTAHVVKPEDTDTDEPICSMCGSHIDLYLDGWDHARTEVV